MEFPCTRGARRPPSSRLASLRVWSGGWRVSREKTRRCTLYPPGARAGMHDAMAVAGCGLERGGVGGGGFCFVQIWLWVCTADAKGVKSRKTAARAKHTSLSAPCRPVTPAAHNLLPFNLALHSSFPFKIVLRVVAIADSAVSDFKARQVDRGRRTQIVSASSLPPSHSLAS